MPLPSSARASRPAIYGSQHLHTYLRYRVRGARPSPQSGSVLLTCSVSAFEGVTSKGGRTPAAASSHALASATLADTTFAAAAAAETPTWRYSGAAQAIPRVNSSDGVGPLCAIELAQVPDLVLPQEGVRKIWAPSSAPNKSKKRINRAVREGRRTARKDKGRRGCHVARPDSTYVQPYDQNDDTDQSKSARHGRSCG